MAREKKQALILSFEKTTDAMLMEKFCMRNNLPGRLIPVPREITAGCGLAWKAEPDMEEKLLAGLKESGISYSGKYVLML